MVKKKNMNYTRKYRGATRLAWAAQQIDKLYDEVVAARQLFKKEQMSGAEQHVVLLDIHDKAMELRNIALAHPKAKLMEDINCLIEYIWQ